MRAKYARIIRAAIIDARTKGWRKPPEVAVYRGRGGGALLGFVSPLYGEAWERTMRRRGLYPPPAPRSRPSVSPRADKSEPVAPAWERLP